LAEKAKSTHKKLILNPAPAVDLPESVYQRLFLITPNETEASLLSGIPCEQETDYPRVAQWFLDKGVQQVVITLGEKGAFFKNAELELRIPAPSVAAVDTTAAGDVFNGTLAVALAEGQYWEKALQTAIQAASLSVTRMGAQASAPFRSEVLK
jgi:ribokinase